MQKDQGFWPATVYLEGLDQYRGWFQSSLLTAVGALGKGAPFKECVTHGWTVDGEGKAMHKSLGNGVDPADVFKKYGADICRLWAGSRRLSCRRPLLRRHLPAAEPELSQVPQHARSSASTTSSTSTRTTLTAPAGHARSWTAGPSRS